MVGMSGDGGTRHRNESARKQTDLAAFGEAAATPVSFCQSEEKLDCMTRDQIDQTPARCLVKDMPVMSTPVIG